MKKYNLIKKQKGFTLTETILVVAVILVLIAFIFIGYRSTAMDAEVKKANQEVTMILDAAESITNDRVDYNGLTMKMIFDSNAMPSGVGNSTGSTFLNPWGGQYVMSITETKSGAKDLVNLTSYNVPQAACAKIITKLGVSVFEIKVNNKVVALSPPASGGVWNRYQVDVKKAVPLCQSTNTIIFSNLKPFDTATYLNPATTEVSGAQLTFAQAQQSRIQAAMQQREQRQLAL